MRLFLDTNVILDIVLCRQPFFEDSYHSVRDYQEQNEFCFSASSATDLYYLIRKASGPDVAKNAISTIVSLFKCVDTQQGDIINALASEMKDFEDAVLSSVADRVRADYIITRNGKAFNDSEVPVLSPAEFLSMMRGTKPER